MKAKEIAEKFIKDAPVIRSEKARNLALINLINTFLDEYDRIVKLRNPQTDEALPAIFRELDQKWNAVRKILRKKYGMNIIVRDGFGQILKDRLPIAYEYYLKQKDRA